MKKIIVTVGPAFFAHVENMDMNCNNHIYRINGAHGEISDIENNIDRIRSYAPHADILIDLPGNKVRTGKTGFPIQLEVDRCFTLLNGQYNYADFYRHVKPGDEVWANDSEFRFIIEEVNEKEIRFLSKSAGILKENKGLHVRGIHQDIPFLFAKDKDLIQVANKKQVAFIGLSFVRNVDDIRIAKSLVHDDVKIISKIETRAAVTNLNTILQETKYILIDRGDLSTEIGLEKIPACQKFIIDKALFHNAHVFLATQFLKNMEEKPLPTMPEVIDLYNSLTTGIYGIQLSEETAVGKYPDRCVSFIKKMMAEILNEKIVD